MVYYSKVIVTFFHSKIGMGWYGMIRWGEGIRGRYGMVWGAQYVYCIAMRDAYLWESKRRSRKVAWRGSDVLVQLLGKPYNISEI